MKQNQYIFNLGDSTDQIYDYEYSTTSGKNDRIVFVEGIKAEDLSIERKGDNLESRYSDTDVVTVKNAYYYGDGRCKVKLLEDKSGLYNIDYDNVLQKLIESYVEVNDDIDELKASIHEKGDDIQDLLIPL